MRCSEISVDHKEFWICDTTLSTPVICRGQETAGKQLTQMGRFFGISVAWDAFKWLFSGADCTFCRWVRNFEAFLAESVRHGARSSGCSVGADCTFFRWEGGLKLYLQKQPVQGRVCVASER
eukprot:114714-Pelagomonas_calceolata.AAC.3